MEIEQIQTLMDRILADGQLTQAEQDELMAAIREDGRVTAEELDLVQSLLDRISRGEIKVVD